MRQAPDCEVYTLVVYMLHFDASALIVEVYGKADAAWQECFASRLCCHLTALHMHVTSTSCACRGRWLSTAVVLPTQCGMCTLHTMIVICPDVAHVFVQYRAK